MKVVPPAAVPRTSASWVRLCRRVSELEAALPLHFAPLSPTAGSRSKGYSAASVHAAAGQIVDRLGVESHRSVGELHREGEVPGSA